MTAVPGSIRRSAYASLMLGNQMVCGWTWQSMHGGEEQYLQGMVGQGMASPMRKYDEYRQIAEEFAKIEKYGFPYQLQADVALAFSFPARSSAVPTPSVTIARCSSALMCSGNAMWIAGLWTSGAASLRTNC